jgi:ATP-dependent 26S proteasome regulatory subunit
MGAVSEGKAMPESDVEKLEKLLRSRHPCVTILTFEEEYALEVARQVAMGRDGQIRVWSASSGVCDGAIKGATPLPDTENVAAALYYLWTNPQAAGLFVFLDLAGHLRDERVLRLLRDLIASCAEKADRTVILIDASDNLPAVIQGTSARLELSFPGEEELTGIVRETCREVMKSTRLQVDLTRSDLDSLVRNLRGLTRRQAERGVYDAIVHDRRLNAADITNLIKFKRQVLSKTGLLELVDAPTSLDQIGGLKALKGWLATRANALSSEAVEFGIEPPRGVLLLGVQGAGKSLAAKAVATAWGRPLMRMDVGAFYNRFIGETERQLRDALRQAEMMAPVVLWIDEIEKAFASAGSESSADGGLSKRMFGSLLTWMQEHRSPVFLIATANDIQSLPPELMRKGRFDEIFFVDLPNDDARRAIFQIHLSKRHRDPGAFDLPALVAASKGYSGAEIEQGIISALHEAFAAGQMLADSHIVRALQASPPLSVTMRERVDWLRAWAANRCLFAD